MASSENYQLFNLNTMSGVYPGTRTMVFQRVRVRIGAAVHWVRVLWYADPPACVLEPDVAVASTPGVAALRIPEPLADRQFAPRLHTALAATGWQLQACGSCTFWQLTTAATSDGLPLGRCTWQGAPADTDATTANADVAAPPAPLQMQSLLALDCTHWQAAPELSTLASAATDQPDSESQGAAHGVAPMRKRAEQESDERWTLLGQLRRFLKRPTQPPATTLSWEDRIVERSGVGAGTEPCFACQGRIANLGALAVASSEGDKQTFSVWRCRQCYTYYLNDWIDRWERTDSLETEESYYRLAPEEALEVLALIDNVVHAEHPAGRFERTAQREWVLAFIAQHPRLSHQIKQGR